MIQTSIAQKRGKAIPASRNAISSILALILITLSGLATDVYIPSLPAMSEDLHASPGAIQFTLAIFLLSYGVAQLFIGGIVDSYGRYLPSLISLLIFTVASILIPFSHNMGFIYAMRVVHGFSAATIIVCKRTYFVDMFTGEKLKHYTSLFSIVWSAAPVVAPFVGGMLQAYYGWHANFYFLAGFGLLMFLLELLFSGETIKEYQPFSPGAIARTYGSMIRSRELVMGMLVLALNYGMLMIYGMASPYLIERVLHYPATVTGNCSLVSGLCVMAGGVLSKSMIRKPFLRKVMLATLAQLAAAVVVGIYTLYASSLFTMITYLIIIHLLAGFVFNNFLSYCYLLFTKNAAKAGGLVGGGFAVLTSTFSYVLVRVLTIKSQAVLGLGYGVFAAMVLLILFSTKWRKTI